METKEALTVRIAAMFEPKLADEIERLARQADRSVSAEVRHAVRGYVDQEGQR